MKNSKFILLLFVLLFLLVGCSQRTAPAIFTQTITQKDTIICIDTIVSVRPDSAQLLLLAKCDSSKQILFSELSERGGERARVQWRVRDNYVYIDCYCDSLEVEVEQYKIINRHVVERYTEATREKSDYKRKYYNALIYAGVLGVLCVLLLIILIKK